MPTVKRHFGILQNFLLDLGMMLIWKEVAVFAIKRMRERAGMTQQEVADFLGIKKPRYGDWERETREINLRDAIRLADLFACTLDELAGRDWPRLRSSLSPEERTVLDAMRSTDARGRAAILRTAEGESGVGSDRDGPLAEGPVGA